MDSFLGLIFAGTSIGKLMITLCVVVMFFLAFLKRTAEKNTYPIIIYNYIAAANGVTR